MYGAIAGEINPWEKLIMCLVKNVGQADTQPHSRYSLRYMDFFFFHYLFYDYKIFDFFLFIVMSFYIYFWVFFLNNLYNNFISGGIINGQTSDDFIEQ